MMITEEGFQKLNKVRDACFNFLTREEIFLLDDLISAYRQQGEVLEDVREFLEQLKTEDCDRGFHTWIGNEAIRILAKLTPKEGESLE